MTTNNQTQRQGEILEIPSWLPEPGKVYEGQLISAVIGPRKNADGEQIIITYWLPKDQSILKTYFPLDVCKIKSGRHLWFLKLGIDPPDEEDGEELRMKLEEIQIQKPFCRIEACRSRNGYVFGYLIERLDLPGEESEAESPSPQSHEGNPSSQGGGSHV